MSNRGGGGRGKGGRVRVRKGGGVGAEEREENTYPRLLKTQKPTNALMKSAKAAIAHAEGRAEGPAEALPTSEKMYRLYQI